MKEFIAGTQRGRNYQLSTINYQLSIINYQPLVPKLSAEKYRQIISRIYPGGSFGNALAQEAPLQYPPDEVHLSKVLSSPPACIEYYLSK